MKIFCSSVTVTDCPVLWFSDVSPFPRLECSIRLSTTGSETEDLPYWSNQIGFWWHCPQARNKWKCKIEFALPLDPFFHAQLVTQCTSWCCTSGLTSHFDLNLYKGVGQTNKQSNQPSLQNLFVLYTTFFAYLYSSLMSTNILCWCCSAVQIMQSRTKRTPGSASKLTFVFISFIIYFIKDWMTNSKLQMNKDNMETMLFGTQELTYIPVPMPNHQFLLWFIKKPRYLP